MKHNPRARNHVHAQKLNDTRAQSTSAPLDTGNIPDDREKPVFQVLLIEDEEPDAELVKEFLLSDKTNSTDNTWDITWEQTLLDGLKRLETKSFDIILLDLGLPDSRGLDTFLQVSRKAKETAIIVLSGQNDKSIAMKAVRNGAQDYLVKGHFEEDLLVRAIRYSHERNKLLQELKQQSKKNQAETSRNYRHFIAMGDKGQESRSDTSDLLKDFYTPYRDLVFQYVRAVRIEEDRPAENVHELAERLSDFQIAAHDIVKLHLKVINEFSQKALPDEERDFSNDARLVLVELMGNMMDRYRKTFKGDQSDDQSNQ